MNYCRPEIPAACADVARTGRKNPPGLITTPMQLVAHVTTNPWAAGWFSVNISCQYLWGSMLPTHDKFSGMGPRRKNFPGHAGLRQPTSLSCKYRHPRKIISTPDIDAPLRFSFRTTISSRPDVAGARARGFNHSARRSSGICLIVPTPPESPDGARHGMAGRIQNPELQHRHISHLWGLYPGDEPRRGHARSAAAARKTLIVRGDASVGWGYAYKAASI